MEFVVGASTLKFHQFITFSTWTSVQKALGQSFPYLSLKTFNSQALSQMKWEKGQREQKSCESVLLPNFLSNSSAAGQAQIHSPPVQSHKDIPNTSDG